MEERKIKVALCLAGQYRTFSNPVVQKSLQHFILNKYDCDTYISTWDDIGKSTNSTSGVQVESRSKIFKESITPYMENAVIEIENYQEWYTSISQELRELITSTAQHSGCIPQLYKKFRAFTLIPKEKEYDFVIMTRPDIFIFNELSLETLDNAGVIWNCNPVGTWAYYPNRIFDILYMGGKEDVEKLSQCYNHITELLEDPFHSGLHPLDCCKMLYTYAKAFCNLRVESTETLLGNIYRDNSSVQYNCTNSGVSIENFKYKLNL